MRTLATVPRIARANRPLLAVLALLVFIPSFLAAAAPGTLTDRYDRALRGTLDGAPAAAREVLLDTAIVGGERLPNGPATEEDLRGWSRHLTELTPRPLRAVAGRAEREARSRVDLGVGYPSGRVGPGDVRLVLSWDPGVAPRIRYVAGEPPHNDASRAPDRPPVLQVALAAKAAERLRLRVGDTLDLRDLRARITGLYAPLSAADPFWEPRARLLTAQELRDPGDHEYLLSTAVLDAPGYAVLYRDTRLDLTYTWRFPVDNARIKAARAQGVSRAVPPLEFATRNEGMRLTTRLGTVLEGFAAQLRVTRTILALVLAGLGAVAVGVLALGCRVLLDRMRPGFDTMRSRGGSLVQLCGVAAATMAVVAVPAAAAGYAGASLLAGGGLTSPALFGVLVILATAIALPVADVVIGHRGPGREERQDLTAAKASPRRLVVEGLIVVLAVIGTVVLRRRGLTTDSALRGTDPFVASVPILLSVAAGLIALRAYPYPLRAVGRIIRRGRFAVGFLGMAQASRQGLVAVLPVVVLLLATAIAGFAATVDAGVRRAQDSSAWQAVGADARVFGVTMDPRAVGRVRRLEGVEDAVPALFTDGVPLTIKDLPPQRPSVIAVDLDAYRRIVAGRGVRMASGARAAGPEAAALFSPDLAATIGSRPASLSWPSGTVLPIRRAGAIDRFPTLPAGQSFVVIPYSALNRLDAEPNTIFVRGHRLDVARLARVATPDSPNASAVSADTYARVHDRLTRAPLVGLVHGAFGFTALAVGGYAALAVLLAVAIGASARGRTVSYLRTLGLGPAQVRRLVMVELGPGIVCAAVTGWALGLLLPRIVGPAMDLRAYTGGFPASDLALDPRWAALLAGALVVSAGLALTVDAAINARRDLGGALRMGDQR